MFPINRCHQRVVTPEPVSDTSACATIGFPVNRCHQRVVTFEDHGTWFVYYDEFPVNRCHQRVVT